MQSQKPRTQSEEEAHRRIQEALDLVEQAQATLGRACEILCPILGSDYHWKPIRKGYDAVHNLHGKVSFATAARTFDMDSDWKRRNEQKEMAS